MQRNCIFPGRYVPLTYYDWLRGRPRITLMARNGNFLSSHMAATDILPVSTEAVARSIPMQLLPTTYGSKCCFIRCSNTHTHTPHSFLYDSHLTIPSSAHFVQV